MKTVRERDQEEIEIIDNMLTDLFDGSKSRVNIRRLRMLGETLIKQAEKIEARINDGQISKESDNR